MKKLILLGLDGGTWKALDPFIEAGELPFFKQMKEQGVWGSLRSVVLPLTATGWSSICTGKNPGKHGVFDFCKDHVKGGYVSSADVKAKFIWEYLEEQGIKCGVINIPLSSPLRSKISFAEGDHLRKDWMNFSWPKDTTAGLNANNPLFNNRLLDIIDIRFDQLDHILKEREFQFLAMNISVHDAMLHYRWVSNPDFVKNALSTIDKKLEQFVQKLDNETTLLIVSDHGMIKLTKKFYVHNWLEQAGYLHLKSKAKKSVLVSIGINKKNYRKILNPIVSFLVRHNLMRLFSKKLRNKFRFTMGRVLPDTNGINPQVLPSMIDWGKTQAFGFGNLGRITLNVKGKQETGIVEPEQYEFLRNEIIAKLKEFCEKENLALQVFKKEEVYEGPYLDEAPDILYIMEEGAVHVLSAYQFSKQVLADVKVGEVHAEHHIHGIFTATGNNIKQGQQINASVLDITPTILAHFGLPIPSDMDGRVLTELFEEDLVITKEKITEKKRILETIQELSL